MLEIHKNYLLDEHQQLLAVQIPISEFEQIEKILENFGLNKLMADVEDDERLGKHEARRYFRKRAIVLWLMP